MVIDRALKMGLTAASPGATRCLSVLIYHRVLSEPDPLLPGLVDVRTFERQIESLARSFNLMPLPQAIAALSNGTLPPRAASITFDDGYADNHDVALPILTRKGLHATFFIASGYVDGGYMWNDGVIEAIRRSPSPWIDVDDLELGRIALDSTESRRKAIVSLITRLKYCSPSFRADWTRRLLGLARVPEPFGNMMSSDQIRELSRRGMDIGAHTVTHPILTKIDLEHARREINEGRERLESILQRDVRLFAYPNGRPGIDFGPQHVELVKDLGFDAALSTRWGAAQTGDDLFQLPRFTSWGRSEFRFQARMALNILRSRLDLPSPPYWELSN